MYGKVIHVLGEMSKLANVRKRAGEYILHPLPRLGSIFSLKK